MRTNRFQLIKALKDEPDIGSSAMWRQISHNFYHKLSGRITPMDSTLYGLCWAAGLYGDQCRQAFKRVAEEVWGLNQSCYFYPTKESPNWSATHSFARGRIALTIAECLEVLGR